MAKVQMISPIVYVYDCGGGGHATFGWWLETTIAGESGVVHPIVGNPDGSGIGPWFQYYGDDPWSIIA